MVGTAVVRRAFISFTEDGSFAELHREEEEEEEEETELVTGVS